MNGNGTQKPGTLLIGQVAEELGVTRQWIRELLSMGNIPVQRAGEQGVRIFTPENVEQLRALLKRRPQR